MKKFFAVALLAILPVLAKAQLTVSISNVINVSCYAACNGSATASATGGVPPYNYSWMPGSVVGPTYSNMCAGSYTLTVTDAASASASATVVITQPPQLTCTITPASPSVCLGGIVNYTGNISGGSGPYTYSWVCPGGSPSSATSGTPSITYNTAGVYITTLTVTDGNACNATHTVVVNVSATTVGGSISGSGNACPGNNSGTLVLSGYTGNVIRWEKSTDGGVTWINIANVSTTQTYSNISVTTIYRAMVQSGNCPAAYSSNATITLLTPPVISASEIPSTCNQSNGVVSASGALSYSWMPGNFTTASVNGVSSGTTYTVTGTDANGCTGTSAITTTDSCDYVWPGDANDDAVADNTDILDIGIANGATGTTRANASLTWVGQPSTLWGTTLPSGTDYKWVDCDGNGAINPIDTQAVVLNFGMTHSNRVPAPSTTESAPTLAISFNQDSIAAGNTGTITVSLGDAANQATNIYGVAFRLNYDAAQMNTSTFGMTGGANWLGTPGSDQMRVVLHPSPANGFVDVAITRLDQQNVSGNGTIGTIYFTATNTLDGSGNAVTVNASVSNVLVIDNSGTPQTVNVANDSVVVADSAVITSVNTISSDGFSLYPNPANDHVVINLGSDFAQRNAAVNIYDANGKLVSSAFSNGKTMVELNTAQLSAGTYSISVVSAGVDAMTQQLIITR